MEWVTPYVLRHAGPSWDRLQGARALLEVQRRGQWNTTSTLNRYERDARLQADDLKFSKPMRLHFGGCMSLLEGVLRHGASPPTPPPPSAGCTLPTFSQARAGLARK